MPPRIAQSKLALRSAAVVALVTIPTLWIGPPKFWKLPVIDLVVIAALCLAYLLAAALAFRRSPPRAPFAPWLAGLAAFGICCALLLAAEWLWPHGFASPFSRPALFSAVALALTCLMLERVAPAGRVATFAALLLAGAGLVGHVAQIKHWFGEPAPPSPDVKVAYVDTTFYELRLTAYRNWLPLTPGRLQERRNGGGLAAWGGAYLVVDGTGALYRVEPRSHELQVETLPHEVPINIAQFEAGARRVYARAVGDWVESTRFRVSGILLEQAGERTRIYATHHWWNDRDSCFVMRVSVIEGTLAQLRDPAAPIAWRTLFESRPCLPLNVDNPRGPRFEGLESGGRMLRFDDETLLLSLGDHGFDGLNRREALAQDPATSFGKLLRVRTADGSATVHTLGHRNPQGLLRATDGTIWELEHGPHGGDELNRIVEGRNYGWPRVTYGTDYGRRSWPANPLQGRHEGYERPAYVFLPSVAVSNLVQAHAGRLPLWDGDLLLGTLKGLALERVRLEDGHVQFVEPVPVGYRVRDLVIGSDGRIALWTDERALVIVEPTETHVGDALFSQCSICHGLNMWDASWKAPNLYKIVDRPVASADDFAYSAAMRELGGSWTRARLEAFIEDPQRFLPGTSMAFPGVRNPAERKAIVDFLVSRRDADD